MSCLVSSSVDQICAPLLRSLLIVNNEEDAQIQLTRFPAESYKRPEDLTWFDI
jgi:hypothetical protein